VRLPENSPIYSCSSGVGKEDFSNEKTVLQFQWFDVETLDAIPLVPPFLKGALKNIPLYPTHLIMDELKGK